MPTNERFDSSSQPDAGVRREELRFDGEHSGFDPQTRARQLGEIALVGIRMWAKNEEVIGDARLVLTELLANTFQHGKGPVEMKIASIKTDAGEAYIEISMSNVAENSPGARVPDINNATSESGRGVRIIDGLTSGNWQQEIEPLPDGSGFVVRITASVQNDPSHFAPNGDHLPGSANEVA